MMKYYSREKWSAKITLWHAYLKSGYLYGLAVVYPFLCKTKKKQMRTLFTTTMK